ncbi:TIM barrel protein [Candidatus Poribacteria bacterium]|nr:TIM barrel protein [Candidatus Poribacteria bacterium]
MKIGCQIGVWGGSPEQTTKEMGSAGIEGIEVFTVHLNQYFGQEKGVRKFLEDNNIELTGAYFNNDKFISAEKEDEVLSEAVKAADFLAKVNSSFIILNGGVPKNQKPEGFNNDDFKQLAKTMNSIGKAVKNYGVSACIHPHAGCMIETPEELDKLLEYLDTSLVGLCLHAAHQVIAGADPYEMYEKHAALVTYLHIGAIGEGNKGAMLGEGILNQKRLMKPILEAGYDGWIIVESSKQDVPAKDYVLKAKDYIEKELLK